MASQAEKHLEALLRDIDYLLVMPPKERPFYLEGMKIQARITLARLAGGTLEEGFSYYGWDWDPKYENF